MYERKNKQKKGEKIKKNLAFFFLNQPGQKPFSPAGRRRRNEVEKWYNPFDVLLKMKCSKK